jgi:hypothetical protein
VTGCIVAVMSVLAFIAPQSQSGSPNQELIESVARKMHERFQTIRKSEYGNIHFSVTYSAEDSTGFFQRRKIRFWSRNDSMFRIDEEIIASKNKEEVGRKNRIVARPEGFVELKNSDKGYAVTNYGTEVAGRDKIEVSSIYAASTRCYSIMNGEVLFGPVEKMEYTNEFSKKKAATSQVLAIQENGSDVTVKTRFQLKTGEQETWNIHEGVLDTEHGVVKSFAITESQNGDRYDEFRCTKDYDFPNLQSIPTSISIVRTKGGVTVRESYVLDSYDSSPVPIGIFALGMKSLGEERSSGPWMTRLLIAGVGLTAIIVYLLHRHRTRTS